MRLRALPGDPVGLVLDVERILVGAADLPGSLQPHVAVEPVRHRSVGVEAHVIVGQKNWHVVDEVGPQEQQPWRPPGREHIAGLPVDDPPSTISVDAGLPEVG